MMTPAPEDAEPTQHPANDCEIPMTAIDELLDLLEIEGGRQYGGESVSQREHALQCARLAEVEGAPPSLVAAALLHDIGHLLHSQGPRPALRGIDDRHELVGHKHLLRALGPEVAEPVRLHVPAKRYLCATEPSYFALLSAGSVRSLALQGGAFNPSEAEAFAAQPYAAAAVRVRRWDEAAKIPGLATPPLAHYRAALEAAEIG
jgi:[1-hydroxy-2-(trimethylamino)ethyl]phosphonate dioxygenase